MFSFSFGCFFVKKTHYFSCVVVGLVFCSLLMLPLRQNQKKICLSDVTPKMCIRRRCLTNYVDEKRVWSAQCGTFWPFHFHSSICTLLKRAVVVSFLSVFVVLLARSLCGCCFFFSFLLASFWFSVFDCQLRVWYKQVMLANRCVTINTVNKLNNQQKRKIQSKEELCERAHNTRFPIIIHSICWVARLNLHLLDFTIEITSFES